VERRKQIGYLVPLLIEVAHQNAIDDERMNRVLILSFNPRVKRSLIDFALFSLSIVSFALHPVR
jgi:hypothetical protein